MKNNFCILSAWALVSSATWAQGVSEPEPVENPPAQSEGSDDALPLEPDSADVDTQTVIPPWGEQKLPLQKASSLTAKPQSQNAPLRPQRTLVPDGHPRLFLAHTGHLLPSSTFYLTTGLDTTGGFAADVRFGLGGVAEFGLEHYDQAQWESEDGTRSGRVAPLFLATFKIGLPERRFFNYQPAISLGLRKSFESEVESYKIRTAELFLVASKALTSRMRIHAGGVIADGELRKRSEDAGDAVFFNERSQINQLGVTAGLEFDLFPDSTTIFEWSNAPHFVLARDRDPSASDMSLQSQLLWGVRYKLSREVAIESGVRVRDMKNAQIIDAQIFGRVTFVSDDGLAQTLRGL